MEFTHHKSTYTASSVASTAASMGSASLTSPQGGEVSQKVAPTTHPMLMRPLKLTPAGRPELMSSGMEVELLSEAGIGVYSYSATMLSNNGGKGRATIIWSNCHAILTNLRVIILYNPTSTTPTTSPSPTLAAVYIPLATIQSAEDLATFFRSSARIRIRSRSGTHAIELKFNEGGKEGYLMQLHRALQRKSWESVPGARALEATGEQDNSSSSSSSSNSSSIGGGSGSTPSSGASFSSRSAGVSGIIRRREQALGAADAVAEAAMGDLDALMKAAGEMVQLVERYSAILAEKSSRSSSSTSASGTSASGSTSGRGGNGGSDGAWSYDLSETSSEAGERNEVENILQIIGVISPVTKFSAGRLYHEQLAQQIADMLLTNDCINRLGGMVAATDVYCVYNRARGTELVSPDDFHQAIKLFNARPGLHLQVVQLDSGVSVIKDTKLSQSDIFNRVADLARQQPVRGISINDVSVAFHVSYLIARDQVLAAEAAGRLCRDDCLSGVQFFENVYWL